MDERLGIVGSGAIACGLAAAGDQQGEGAPRARSDSSADRARKTVDKATSRMEDVDGAQVAIVQDLGELQSADIVIEAIAEDVDAKAALWGQLAEVVNGHTLLGSTTSSLSVAQIASASGAPERFVGLHVFNPVPRMQLVELAF